ncbi:unnamed protein product [Lactuca virosa]|uniref:Uncharacterized protein n=1 Tax=Lactuca virosa TaxID=75947 RepID=A0AAU9NT16_9ASTR|nr:unnamed protein product [Lactuca virosa]
MSKIKTKLTADAFRANQSMLPLILALKIVPVDKGYPIKKPDEVPKEPLIPPTSELIITQLEKEEGAWEIK